MWYVSIMYETTYFFPVYLFLCTALLQCWYWDIAWRIYMWWLVTVTFAPCILFTCTFKCVLLYLCTVCSDTDFEHAQEHEHKYGRRCAFSCTCAKIVISSCAWWVIHVDRTQWKLQSMQETVNSSWQCTGRICACSCTCTQKIEIWSTKLKLFFAKVANSEFCI